MGVRDVMAALAEVCPVGDALAEDVTGWLEVVVVAAWNLNDLDPAARPVLAAPAWGPDELLTERVVDELMAAGADAAAGGARVSDLRVARDSTPTASPPRAPAGPVRSAAPSTTSSPAVENRRRYTAIQKEAAVLAGRRDGPARACRDLGVSSTSLLRHWSMQYAEAGDSIPPTWLRNGKPGPATNAELAAPPGVTIPDEVDLDDDERQVLASALEREGVDVDALEDEAVAFPDAGPMERMPVVEHRARDAAAEALYDGP